MIHPIFDNESIPWETPRRSQPPHPAEESIRAEIRESNRPEREDRYFNGTEGLIIWNASGSMFPDRNNFNRSLYATRTMYGDRVKGQVIWIEVNFSSVKFLDRLGFQRTEERSYKVDWGRTRTSKTCWIQVPAHGIPVPSRKVNVTPAYTMPQDHLRIPELEGDGGDE